PVRPEESNKGTFGRVLVVGGSDRFIGAVRLVAEGAYRSGAGLDSVATTEGVIRAVAGALAEATWLELPHGDGGIAQEAVHTLRSAWQDAAVAVRGPGMGDREATAAFTWAAL